jgi:hypothetical protein
MKIPKQNLLELEEYLELCDEIVCVLQKMRKLVSYYQQGLCNPFSKESYNLLLFNSLNLDMGGLMSQESGENNS